MGTQRGSSPKNPIGVAFMAFDVKLDELVVLARWYIGNSCLEIHLLTASVMDDIHVIRVVEHRRNRTEFLGVKSSIVQIEFLIFLDTRCSHYIYLVSKKKTNVL
jgi:hypothetical protein